MYIKEFKDFSSIIRKFPQGKVYFAKNGGNWDVTLKRCLHACKILKTIYYKFEEHASEYNLVYKTTILYKPTTISFEYESNTYTIIIKTGIPLVRGEFTVKNYPINFTTLEDRLDSLISEMKTELPSLHADKLCLELDSLAFSSD